MLQLGCGGVLGKLREDIEFGVEFQLIIGGWKWVKSLQEKF